MAALGRVSQNITSWIREQIRSLNPISHYIDEARSKGFPYVTIGLVAMADGVDCEAGYNTVVSRNLTEAKSNHTKMNSDPYVFSVETYDTNTKLVTQLTPL